MTDVNYENIERYLSGDMTEKERSSFEDELDGNEELAQELRFYMYVNKSVAECLRQSCVPGPKKQVSRFPSLKNIRANRQIKWGILALTTLLFGGVLLWSPWTNDGLVEANQVKMSAVDNDGLLIENKYPDIIELFNDGKYTEALPLLNNALTEVPDDLYIRYYRGVTYLNLAYLGSARRDLLKVYSESTSQMYEAAYYIALSYTLEEDDYAESALNWLEKIPKEAAIYPKAAELMKKL
ncbi:hypothetical protein H8S90_03345 [Olivibacter sp. SDN3]|uniref:tetratricopeptide repeat protein n=1 Tax=Olivibacter sp. SDN3 TaxID=2764720 RepID=UPI001650EE63|nr:hypothetical protein [Olivibacter sp. SDN3]QNL50650.1 hypothetical protein H8S90_03345 [Olivibacter sp. SDN3]